MPFRCVLYTVSENEYNDPNKKTYVNGCNLREEKLVGFLRYIDFALAK